MQHHLFGTRHLRYQNVVPLIVLDSLQCLAHHFILTKQVLFTGGAEATYANATRSFLLRHVRPAQAAQQAAAWAHAHVSPTSLRVFAGFYSGSLPQRQEALEALLTALGNALRQEYSSMWDQNAMSVFVMKVCVCACVRV
jgi:hypothetical protein